MLTNNGVSKPVTFSNNKAGPPALITLSVISVISSSWLTGAVIRRSSPLFSRKLMNSLRSLNFILIEALGLAHSHQDFQKSEDIVSADKSWLQSDKRPVDKTKGIKH